MYVFGYHWANKLYLFIKLYLLYTKCSNSCGPDYLPPICFHNIVAQLTISGVNKKEYSSCYI